MGTSHGAKYIKQPIFTERDYAILRNSINRLSRVEQKIIFLRFWGSLSIQEIARMQRMSWSRVNELLEKAFVKLREIHEIKTSFARHLSALKLKDAA